MQGSGANPGAMRSQDSLVGSDNYGSTGYSSNYDWFLTSDDSRFTSNKDDESCSELQQNPPSILSGNRLNLTGFNVNGSRPHCLQQPHPVSHSRGSILLLAKDKYGCQLLQEMLMKGLKTEDFSRIFLELIGHVNELAQDPFGNYLFQTLVEVCTEEQRTQIIRVITSSDFQFVHICLNFHGSRAAQKLLEHVTTQNQQTILILALIPGVVALTKDFNGHLVILQCLKHFSDQKTKQFVNHSKGVTKGYLISIIAQLALDLARDRYGNYVVQHLISLRIDTVAKTILRKLQGNFVSLSCNKYSSNVVQKLIESGEEYCRTQIILELLQDTNGPMLLVDPYGNYVIQSALMASKGRIRDAILRLIELNSLMMSINIFGKKILAQFDKAKYDK
ncbi:pumilio-like protein 12-like [Senna tora]|uniref:Pumilio-like protein 12-like n=1 Tax=Senna tora TaxID=362788 RepID=A0A834TAM9_9FABA|nr:pumilio-like protein 12-like [Senna tora]